jgi:hypothetical protein
MTIKIYKDKIEFTDGANTYTLAASNFVDGFNFNGELTVKQLLQSYSFQGSNHGYTVGGSSTSSSDPSMSSTMDRFPFATNVTAASIGSLRGLFNLGSSGNSSLTNGYIGGGRIVVFPSPGIRADVNTIEKYAFAAGNSSAVSGNLTRKSRRASSQSSSTSGYTSGGDIGEPTFAASNVIDKFPFASDANATDVGDMTIAGGVRAGQSSTVSGYASGGSTSINTIDKFPFATDANATDVGDLTQSRGAAAGQSSTVSGYTSGGDVPAPGAEGSGRNTIDKFPFATDANATDVGDLTQVRESVVGHSSAEHGYTAGGRSAPPVPASTIRSTIDRFPFASDANAVGFGSLSQARWLSSSGQQ